MQLRGGAPKQRRTPSTQPCQREKLYLMTGLQVQSWLHKLKSPCAVSVLCAHHSLSAYTSLVSWPCQL